MPSIFMRRSAVDHAIFPNPPPNWFIKNEMGSLWRNPDHRQSVRCKAP
jgi:hypothetical protein